MATHEAARTLVKSPPELWEVCSDAESLARHLQPFGEIRITRLDPETTVAWEGERASGTVTIEPSGWGTKVTLTALAREPEPAAAEPLPVAEPVPVADPVPVPEAEPGVAPAPPPAAAPPRGGGLLARLLGIFRSQPAPVPPPAAMPAPAPAPVIERVPEPAPQPPAEPTPAAEELADAVAVLDAALDSLGQAHHRPFSRG